MQEVLERQELLTGQNTWGRVDVLYPEFDKEATRIAESVGSVALGNLVDVETVQEEVNETTLMSAIQLAALGDAESRKLVEENVRTDYAERLFKSKHQTEVKFDLVNGRLSQNSRSNVDVFENTLKHSELNNIMLTRTKIEYKNSLLFDILARNGVLEDNYVLVASPTPTDQETKRKFNFFEDTDTMSLQLLGGVGDEFTLETAFVAGKTHKEGERHDIDAIMDIAENNGVTIEIEAVDELLQYVLIIPKSQLPNGVSSVVEQYDDAAGDTFYGENEARQNYIEFAEKCKQMKFEQATQRITNSLIAEASTFKKPIDANIRLDELSGSEAVSLAVKDTRINVKIFGTVAAPLIEQARVAQMFGNSEVALCLTQEAQKVETSGSCPFASSKSSGGPDNLLSDSESSSDKESEGSKEMTCPFCKEKTFGDPCGQHITCTNCSASTSCSEAENEKRANDYKLKKKNEAIIKVLKLSKEMKVKNEQFTLAA